MVSYGTGLFGRRPFGRCQLTSLGSDPVNFVGVRPCLLFSQRIGRRIQKNKWGHTTLTGGVRTTNSNGFEIAGQPQCPELKRLLRRNENSPRDVVACDR